MRRFLGVIAGLAGWASSSPAQSKAPVRDSAGIRIVTSEASRSDRPLYRVDSLPLVDLGAGDADEEFAEPILTARLRDGRIVIATGGSEIRFYSPAGKRVATFGRNGSGPGEFRRISHLGVGRADTLVVFDLSTNRLTLVSPAATLVRSVSFANGRRRLVGVFPDDALLVAPTGGAGLKNGVFRDTLPYLVANRAGDSLGTVGRFPGSDRFIEIAAQGKQVTSVSISALPFGREGIVAVADSGVVVAPGDRYELFRYDRTGKLQTTIRRAHRPEGPTAADLNRLIDVDAAGIPAGQAGAKERLRESLMKAPLPKTKPPYDAVRARGGELWVRDYSRLYRRERPSRWSVFDRAGVWITTVETPPGFDPQVIGTDFMLGTWLDQDDLAHVRLLRLSPVR